MAPDSINMASHTLPKLILLLEIVFHKIGWHITTASVRQDLLSESMSYTTGACKACRGGGVAPPSSVKIT